MALSCSSVFDNSSNFREQDWDVWKEPLAENSEVNLTWYRKRYVQIACSLHTRVPGDLSLTAHQL